LSSAIVKLAPLTAIVKLAQKLLVTAQPLTVVWSELLRPYPC
jgi:hypothetical protein